ncbi:MAG: 6-bladed beta-propeller [Mediterranea massiliensis]|nr:6-bladed beta-propeller [Mediterranea massiliensis]
MKTLIYICIFILCCACSGGNKQHNNQPILPPEDYVIELEEAFANTTDRNLSEFVDSVVFLPLPSQPLLPRRSLIEYSKPYFTYFSGPVFDAQGKYVGNVGSMGQGAGEESNGWGYSVLYDEVNDLFYTKGDKIIQFDKNRKFTGKDLRIAYRDRTGSALPQGLSNPYTFVRSGKYNVVYNYPDSAYWMDKNLNIVKKERLIPTEWLPEPFTYSILMDYTFSTFRDTTYMYNCFTDELCTVTEDGIKPRWKIVVGKERAENRCFLKDKAELFEQTLVKTIRSLRASGNRNPQAISQTLGNSELAQLIDGKKWVGEAYESNRYVVLSWNKLVAFKGYRENNPRHWIFYDKKTQQTISVDNLINDMDGAINFNPSESIMGINDGIIMTTIWPYEIKAYMDECQEKGKTVSPQIQQLMKNYHSEDNPIIVLAYLKK